MLLDVYLINGEGEDTKVEPSDVKLTSSTLAIVVSHTDHITYVFKGAKVSVVQKFASARKAAALRLQRNRGYRSSFHTNYEFSWRI